MRHRFGYAITPKWVFDRECAMLQKLSETVSVPSRAFISLTQFITFASILLAAVSESRPADQANTTLLIGWMIFLLGTIYLIGHYAGMMIFMFLLLHFKAKESLRLSVIVTLIVTAIIFVLFEQIFNIELYRGLIFRSI
jgi:hypothetical protein